MVEYDHIRTGRHCAFLLHAHLVFLTTYRHQVFSSPHLESMEQIMRDVCASSTPAAGHVHLLENFPPTAVLRQYIHQKEHPP